MGHEHSVIDSDARFTIDPVTRMIKNESKKKLSLIQGDHNSEIFSFTCPRFIESHDMAQCNKVEVHFFNYDAQTNKFNSGIYEANDLQVGEDENNVEFSWTISGNGTQLQGRLEFLIRFKCVEEDVVTYAWNTAFFTEINIGKGSNADALFETEYVDIIEQWKASVLQKFEDEFNEWKEKIETQVAVDINAWKQEAHKNVDEHLREHAAQWDNGLANANKQIGFLSNYVTPQMFGAKGDGVTDDTEALKEALKHTVVHIPDGIYLVSSPLIICDTTRLWGGTNTTIKASAAMECILKNDENVYFANQNFSIRDISLDGNQLSDVGIYLQKISMEHFAAVDGLKIRNCVSVGVHLHLCQTSAFYNIRVTDCGNGVLVDGCNNAKFYNMSACSNAGYGVKVNAVAGGSGGVSIFGIHAEQNGGDGLILNGVNSMASVYGGWIEENDGHGLYIYNSMVNVSGLTVTGTGKGNNRWLYIVGDLTTVENCFRAMAAGDASWADAYVEGNSHVRNINNFQGIELDTISAIESFSDMLTNGNCEGNTGWKGSSTTLTHQSAEKVHSGNCALKAVASASGASTYQTITNLKIGSVYHFVGYVHSVDVSRLRVYFKYANNENSLTNKFYYDIPDKDWALGVWIPIDFYFRAKDNSYDVHIQCVGSGGSYYMDDFSIREYVPEAKSTQKIGNANVYLCQFPVLADY